MMIENEYIKRIKLEHRKKYAQFFTPEGISDFMASWILDGLKGKIKVLEPAFGLGVFCRSLHKLNSEITVEGYDIDKVIYSYAKGNFKDRRDKVHIINENYLTSSWSKQYDGIICNPPYLKFHDYDNTTLIPIVNNTMHTHLNGFTNIYSLFLLKSIYQLKQGGRLAYIVPSEFLNADYGVEVKKALLDSGVLRHIIIVDFNDCAFDDALTTACILLCHKQFASDEIRFSNIKSIDQLSLALSNYQTYSSNELEYGVKWKRYYDPPQSSKYLHLVPFSTFAKVSRGIATGANNYFTFKASKIDLYNIPEKCFRRCICHSTDVQNLVFSEEDFEQLASKDKTVYLFDGCEEENEQHVKFYLSLGVEQKINKRYLTASRKPWYSLENRKPSPIWVSVFSRNGLRFVRNKAGVYNLTTFHCVYNTNAIDVDVLFAYLVTDMAKEIFLDNSRQYGNGLTKLEPNDLNKGEIVDLSLLTKEEILFVSNASQKLQFYGGVSAQIAKILDDFFRKKYTGQNIHISYYIDLLEAISVNISSREVKREKPVRVKQLNLMDLFAQYGKEPIADNCMAHDNEGPKYIKRLPLQFVIDDTKSVLISLVKKDYEKMFLDNSATIYYTGKKIPTSIALNRLFYFMPYIKGKGVKDLWLIKIARLGYRKEGTAEEDKNDLRLVFEIEYIKPVFEDYRPIELKIWRTFTETTLKELQKVKY